MSEVHKRIGDKLRARREGLNLSLEDIFEETKITLDYLQAIENGQIDSFPSAVYYDMFARSYAKEMEMDADQLFEELKAKPEPVADTDAQPTVTQEAKTPVTPKKNTGFSFVKLAAWLGGIIILAFIIVVVWSVTVGKKAEPPSEEKPPANTTDSLEQTKPTLVEPIEFAGQKSSADLVIELPEFEPVKPMILQVATKDSCWVMVLADGDTVLNRNLPGGIVRELSAAYRFLVSAGNPGALEISLDGKLLKPLSASGRPYRDREINQLNKKDYLAEPEESVVEAP